MDEEKFKKLVSEALDLIPEEFASRLNNVEVTISDWPNPYQAAKARIRQGGILLGLYEGVPQTKRGIYYSAVPDKITIFKNPILLISKTEDEVRQQVRNTVIHEIGHHFGMTDEQLRKAGK